MLGYKLEREKKKFFLPSEGVYRWSNQRGARRPYWENEDCTTRYGWPSLWLYCALCFWGSWYQFKWIWSTSDPAWWSDSVTFLLNSVINVLLLCFYNWFVSFVFSFTLFMPFFRIKHQTRECHSLSSRPTWSPQWSEEWQLRFQTPQTTGNNQNNFIKNWTLVL